MTCEWCGHEHPVTQLCAKRPTWGRRGFLKLVGAAAIGVMVPQAPKTYFRPDGTDVLVDVSRVFHSKPVPTWAVGQLITSSTWNRYIYESTA